MIIKGMGNEDLKSFHRDTVLLESAMAEEARVLSAMKKLEVGSNPREYFGDGELVVQMPEACGELGADVKGEFPVYGMFPYRVRIDAENQNLYLDRKKVQYVCPKGLVRQTEAGQDKLIRTSSNALIFVNKLADVYGLTLLKLEEQPGANICPTNLYRFLMPTGRPRKDYGQQSYTFDSTRLYNFRTKEIKDGQRVQFGPNHEGGKAIRILDS